MMRDLYVYGQIKVYTEIAIMVQREQKENICSFFVYSLDRSVVKKSLKTSLSRK